MRMVAVDPGKTTGFAFYDDEPDRVAPQQEPLNKALDIIWSELGNLDRIVVERFTVTERTIKLARDNTALYGVGTLSWFAWHADVQFVLQQPADAKRLITDVRLRRLGWYRSTVGGHANDAARHLAYNLARSGLLDLP